MLSASDSICTSCEKELFNSSPTLEKMLTPTPWQTDDSCSVCPSCNNCIPEFDIVRYPNKSPWYKYQSYRTRCPTCKAYSCGKYVTKAYLQKYVVLLIIWLFFPFYLLNQWALLSRIVFITITVSYIAIILYRSHSDPVKYVIIE